MTPDRCYDRALQYKPQWAIQTPAGFRDETFLVPFHFTVPATGQIIRQLPWTLDDDVPYILRGIIFTQIGTTTYQVGSIGGNEGVGLARMWDCNGNPMSQGLVLGLGMWGNASVSNQGPIDIYGWGWPIEDEVHCPAGGTLTFDFQLSTNAGIAFIQIAGVLASITFYAGVTGVGGNAYSITLIDPGAPNVALSVAVVGGVNVQVTLATDGAGVITSTFAQVADLINTSPITAGVMLASFGGDGTEVLFAQPITALENGSASEPIEIYGTLLGVKRFKDC